jgi:hypothetical protein
MTVAAFHAELISLKLKKTPQVVPAAFYSQLLHSFQITDFSVL